MNILISAGPTREYLDPVRFISNRSSGKMGYALAEVAGKQSHVVTLISGPVNIKPPKGNVTTIYVETASEMAREIRKHASEADLIIMAAAVADYAPAVTAKQKIKKREETLTITLKKNIDILKSLGKIKSKNQILVGFAAETNAHIKNAIEKLKSKNLDWIIVNNVARKDIGFDSDYNEVLMISKEGEKVFLPKAKKKIIAKKILQTILSSPKSLTKS